MSKDLKSLFGKNHLLDEKSITILTDALEKNNLPGFDYIEFKQSMVALAKMNLDEAIAMKSAYATAATVGLTKDKLLETAAHYKKILDGEKTKFGDAMQNQITKNVAGKKDEIEKYKTKINELETLIGKHQKTIDTADEKIIAATERINQAKEKFEFAHQSVMNQIEKDIKGIHENV
jgi:hypothetical protein